MKKNKWLILFILAIAFPLIAEQNGLSNTYENDFQQNNSHLEASVSGNPAAVDASTGTGALGRSFGLTENSGIKIGGAEIADTNYVISGGVKPHHWSSNNLLILDVELDLKKLANLEGSKIGVEFLQYNGSKTNYQAGCVQGYNSLPGPSPLNRSELYQLWWRQEFFNKKLIVRIGKVVPTFDFNNVITANSYEDQSLNAPSVTGLIYTPIYVNASCLGVMPGYYNSVAGVTINYLPTKNLFASVGVYDGNLAHGRQTGIELPRFNCYSFQIAEGGMTWEFGSDQKPGKFAIGGWNQTGKLSTPKGTTEKGAQGVYLYASQRLWFSHPGIDNGGISGFFQFGLNDSITLPFKRYIGGGLTALRLIPERPNDSFGVGVAYSWLNRRIFQRKDELIIQSYYQAHLVEAVYLQPVISCIPNPGAGKNLPTAWTATARLIALF